MRLTYRKNIPSIMLSSVKPALQGKNIAGIPPGYGYIKLTGIVCMSTKPHKLISIRYKSEWAWPHGPCQHCGCRPSKDGMVYTKYAYQRDSLASLVRELRLDSPQPGAMIGALRCQSLGK